jgi:hypothetical protein
MRRVFKLAITSVAVLCGVGLCLCLPSASESNEPRLTSLNPLGGLPGTHFPALIRGENLQNPTSVWFDCDRLRASVQSVREVDPPPKKDSAKPDPKMQEVAIDVWIDPAAAAGAHALRMVTPRGISGALWLVVDRDPVIAESNAPHASVLEAQPVPWPVVINGQLGKPGERDFFSFETFGGEELAFEVTTASYKPNDAAADAEIILYQPSGSWFDSRRGIRLEAKYAPRPPLGQVDYTTANLQPRVTRIFPEPGRYVVSVGTLEGAGGPDYSYQLRIAQANRMDSAVSDRWSPLVAVQAPEWIAWKRRDFTDPLGTDWLEKLWLRSARSTPRPAPLVTQGEVEPNDEPSQAKPFPVPAILEGAIGRPGDHDWYRFEAKAGDTLAFEIETPHLPPTFFNPRVTIFDAAGRELASSLYRELGGDGDDWIKSIQPKILCKFDKTGEYRLQVRDLTSRLGGASYAYRIVVRPALPHIGETSVREVDRVNLAPGQTKRLTVVTDFEEGLQGEAAIAVENLPEGVVAAPGVASAEPRVTIAMKPGGEPQKFRHFPVQRSSTLLLIAAQEAQPTPTPRLFRLTVRPIVEGKPGPVLAAQSILLVVTAP